MAGGADPSDVHVAGSPCALLFPSTVREAFTVTDVGGQRIFAASDRLFRSTPSWSDTKTTRTICGRTWRLGPCGAAGRFSGKALAEGITQRRIGAFLSVSADRCERVRPAPRCVRSSIGRFVSSGLRRTRRPIPRGRTVVRSSSGPDLHIGRVLRHISDRRSTSILRSLYE